MDHFGPEKRAYLRDCEPALRFLKSVLQNERG